MSKRLLLLLPLLPLLASCEDATADLYPTLPPVHLPAESRIGANTFGCRVNGQPWEASNSRTLDGRVLTPTARYYHGELRLDAFRRLQVEGPITTVSLRATRVNGPSVYALGGPAEPAGRTAALATGTRERAYAAGIGTLIITRLDTTGAHPVVAGRFELHASLTPDAPRVAGFPAQVRITEGRFDIELNR
ncbi:hypothetical protein MON38_11215 [Hymenobacter sp. DH14]|uniref:Lipid/polyisoprenoid-binding YceI-like domain-containing protein n=1 Tax=Hymenobacter cyanobacteriorum TaxID=2926463 RepID=A0A9X2AHW0_9BACT|nr:hypothetical protein [Hymenobacter cyanobacteriorum]MCI1187990.1 hypothetical protein [Hymenobacter cyanobacteriorum]